MGEPKIRKRKSKSVEAVDNDELPTVDISEVGRAKNKKAKKNKSLEISTEALDESKLSETDTKKAKKHKLAESNEEISVEDVIKVKTKKAKKNKADATIEEINENGVADKSEKAKKKKKITTEKVGDQDSDSVVNKALTKELAAQYPVLKDEALIKKFMAVTFKTHQKTRMREQCKQLFKDTPDSDKPEAIHQHIKKVLDKSELQETDYRRIRTLYNMLLAELGLGRHSKKGTAVEVSENVVKLPPAPVVCIPSALAEDVAAKYPVLADEELVKRFRAVGMSNNHKGRIRQLLRDSLKDAAGTILPDAIHNKMQSILKNPELSNADLMRIRVLYNMLSIAVQSKLPVVKPKKIKEQNKSEKTNEDVKVKGPKRYVVFVGNLPLDITKEKITEHFSLGDRVIDVRVPKIAPGKKSAIAFIEVADELTYELALSKNHTMLDNTRINVLYSTQQNSKVTKTEAKGKVAKLAAMQKSGKLAGSMSVGKKRTARRNKMKAAQKKEIAL